MNNLFLNLGWFSRTIIVLIIILLAIAAIFTVSHLRAVDKNETDWRATNVDAVADFGSTQQLSIMPLVNWHAADDGLKTEAGVSYLIKTDQHQILFDVGFNRQQEQPSPLQHNMAALGIKLTDFDTLFFSHHHLDHSGGQHWVDRNSFSLGQEQLSLKHLKIFSPTSMQYPGSQITVTSKPTVIGRGLISIGAINRELSMGPIKEQALAIHVQGKGIVLIVGCGHQTLSKILQRYDQMFDLPLYGIIGDLHYPVPDGRLNLFGINLQRFLASGSGPWNQISEADIHSDIALLKQRNLGLIGLGGHDTSDTVIDLFSKTFGQRYRPVRVGTQIIAQ